METSLEHDTSPFSTPMTTRRVYPRVQIAAEAQKVLKWHDFFSISKFSKFPLISLSNPNPRVLDENSPKFKEVKIVVER